MIERHAEAAWEGDLKSGKGSLRSEHLDAPYSFASRFESGDGASPEELIGAAHAGCFSMALSLMLSENGYAPDGIRTTATVALDADEGRISRVTLETEAEVSDLDDGDELERIAEEAKENCPVSKALAGTEIVLSSARLAGTSTA